MQAVYTMGKQCLFLSLLIVPPVTEKAWPSAGPFHSIIRNAPAFYNYKIKQMHNEGLQNIIICKICYYVFHQQVSHIMKSGKVKRKNAVMDKTSRYCNIFPTICKISLLGFPLKFLKFVFHHSFEVLNKE